MYIEIRQSPTSYLQKGFITDITNVPFNQYFFSAKMFVLLLCNKLLHEKLSFFSFSKQTKKKF